MNPIFAVLQAVGVKTPNPPLYTEGATLLLRAPQREVSLSRGVFYSGAWECRLCDGTPPAGAWELDGGVGYSMPIEYASGWRTAANQPDVHTPMYLELPAELFPDGDFTVTFTTALRGMDYLGNGHYIKEYQGESEHWSYLLRTPNFSVYTKHKKKTDSLSDGTPIPVTAFYHFYNESGFWSNPPNEVRLAAEGQSFFERLSEPCTYEYSVRTLSQGQARLRVRILDPAGGTLYDNEKQMPVPTGRGDTFRFAIDVPVRLYALALYPFVLNDRERRRNRFAALTEVHGIETGEFLTLGGEAQEALISALSSLSFTESDRSAQEKYSAALAAVKETL